MVIVGRLSGADFAALIERTGTVPRASSAGWFSRGEATFDPLRTSAADEMMPHEQAIPATKEAIARLAASADEQHAYLESILAHLTPEGDATAYGNDELALEFDGIYPATKHMHECGEISQEEIDAARPLDALLLQLSGKQNADFWRRESLWQDPRWEQVRQCARQALSQYPDEERSSDWPLEEG